MLLESTQSVAAPAPSTTYGFVFGDNLLLAFNFSSGLTLRISYMLMATSSCYHPNFHIKLCMYNDSENHIYVK